MSWLFSTRIRACTKKARILQSISQKKVDYPKKMGEVFTSLHDFPKKKISCLHFFIFILLFWSALEFLRRELENPESTLNGHQRMARYLVEIAKDELDLVFQFVRFVIKASPEQGLQVLFHTLCFVHTKSQQFPMTWSYFMSKVNGLMMGFDDGLWWWVLHDGLWWICWFDGFDGFFRFVIKASPEQGLQVLFHTLCFIHTKSQQFPMTWSYFMSKVNGLMMGFDDGLWWWVLHDGLWWICWFDGFDGFFRFVIKASPEQGLQVLFHTLCFVHTKSQRALIN